MGFPVTRAPTDEPFVRQALVHAIDRQRIIDEVIGDQSLPNNLYAPPHSAGASLLLCTRCVFDPDLAAELLIETEPPENSLSLHVVEGSAGEPWAEAIAQLWRDQLGWPVAIVRHTLPHLIGFLQSGVPDGPFILEWTSEYPGAESWMAPLFDRSGLDDFTRFNDRNINRSLEALASLDAESPNRTTHLKDIRTVLAERVPTIPLAVTTRRVAVTDSIDVSSISPGRPPWPRRPHLATLTSLRRDDGESSLELVERSEQCREHRIIAVEHHGSSLEQVEERCRSAGEKLRQ